MSEFKEGDRVKSLFKQNYFYGDRYFEVPIGTEGTIGRPQTDKEKGCAINYGYNGVIWDNDPEKTLRFTPMMHLQSKEPLDIPPLKYEGKKIAQYKFKEGDLVKVISAYDLSEDFKRYLNQIGTVRGNFYSDAYYIRVEFDDGEVWSVQPKYLELIKPLDIPPLKYEGQLKPREAAKLLQANRIAQVAQQPDISHPVGSGYGKTSDEPTNLEDESLKRIRRKKQVDKDKEIAKSKEEVTVGGDLRDGTIEKREMTNPGQPPSFKDWHEAKKARKYNIDYTVASANGTPTQHDEVIEAESAEAAKAKLFQQYVLKLDEYDLEINSIEEIQKPLDIPPLKYEGKKKDMNEKVGQVEDKLITFYVVDVSGNEGFPRGGTLYFGMFDWVITKLERPGRDRMDIEDLFEKIQTSPTSTQGIIKVWAGDDVEAYALADGKVSKGDMISAIAKDWSLSEGENIEQEFSDIIPPLKYEGKKEEKFMKPREAAKILQNERIGQGQIESPNEEIVTEYLAQMEEGWHLDLKHLGEEIAKNLNAQNLYREISLGNASLTKEEFLKVYNKYKAGFKETFGNIFEMLVLDKIK